MKNNPQTERPGMQVGLMAAGAFPSVNPDGAPRYLFQPKFFPPVLM